MCHSEPGDRKNQMVIRSAIWKRTPNGTFQTDLLGIIFVGLIDNKMSFRSCLNNEVAQLHMLHVHAGGPYMYAVPLHLYTAVIL